ncbi:hypothetical protein BT67DRAFT_11897 [Trichocladium antarcticum]|uniref:Uncharacterized protein n=1 Tax=Trichocladium antarcticum TaxID=1450529 RepID=A0AAN6UT04_9PEZI|nr:hypothetical protein BT67DRAFT_11897 [Trichocladium antarcticum]
MIGMSPQVGERPVKDGVTEGGGRSAGIRLLAAAWGVRSSDFPELEFRGMYKCFDCGTSNALGQFGKQQKCRNAPTRMAQADMWPESIDVMRARRRLNARRPVPARARRDLSTRERRGNRSTGMACLLWCPSRRDSTAATDRNKRAHDTRRRCSRVKIQYKQQKDRSLAGWLAVFVGGRQLQGLGHRLTD